MIRTRCLILIIDDNPDDVFIARRAITKARPECSVEVAEGSKLAIEYLGREELPSLILLDLKMPEIDGIELLHYIRSHEQTRYIPVVILSSSKMDDDLKASYTAGTNGFLHKAHDLSEFTAKIKVTLEYWLDINLAPL